MEPVSKYIYVPIYIRTGNNLSVNLRFLIYKYVNVPQHAYGLKLWSVNQKY